MKSFNIKEFIRSWVLPMAAEVLVLVVLFNYIVNITYVPSGSMIPTIDEGSILLSPRLYNIEKIERGDILSFRSDEMDKILIKRLIGMPGETVVIEEDGSIYIEGEKLDEPYVINQQEGFTGEFKVPDGHYLFFGDNRSGSYDARGWDNPYIPADAILSRAKFTVWPLENFGFLS